MAPDVRGGAPSRPAAEGAAQPRAPIGAALRRAPIDAALLARMLQFGDSMLPIGGFAFSSGLESAVQKKLVTDAATLEAWIRTALEQAARGDAVALVPAHAAAESGDVDTLVAIDQLVVARKLSGEARTMSLKMGAKLAQLGADVVEGAPAAMLAAWSACIAAGTTPGSYPVALAVNFAVQGLSARDAFVVHQYGVAATLASAALRLMRIGHVDTQRILARVNAGVEAAYTRAAATSLDHMSGFAPLLDIAAAVHTKAHVRLFMS